MRTADWTLCLYIRWRLASPFVQTQGGVWWGLYTGHANPASSAVQDSLDAGGLPSMPPAFSAIRTLRRRSSWLRHDRGRGLGGVKRILVLVVEQRGLYASGKQSGWKCSCIVYQRIWAFWPARSKIQGGKERKVTRNKTLLSWLPSISGFQTSAAAQIAQG